MDNEFKNVVLSKFKDQDEKIDRLTNMFACLVESFGDLRKDMDFIKSAVISNTKRLDLLAEEVISLKNILISYDKKFVSYDKKFISYDKKFDLHDIRLKSLEEKLDSVLCTLSSINNSFILLEHSFNDKIPALFDSHSANLDKHSDYEKHLNQLDNVSQNHSIRITILEDESKKLSKKLNS